MTEVYMDSVFLLNMGMDYLLCLLTAHLAGIPLRRRRYLLAAFWGGIYAAAVFLPEAVFLSTAPAKLSAGFVLVLIAYGENYVCFGLCCYFVSFPALWQALFWDQASLSTHIRLCFPEFFI